VRGGCACAGTYGHLLLEVSHEKSREITDKINHGDLSEKPGWVRWSLHPTTTVEEENLMMGALKDIVSRIEELRPLYEYDIHRNVFYHKSEDPELHLKMVSGWFDFD
jgi:hypothetical protein